MQDNGSLCRLTSGTYGPDIYMYVPDIEGLHDTHDIHGPAGNIIHRPKTGLQSKQLELFNGMHL